MTVRTAINAAIVIIFATVTENAMNAQL
jgi:hypothetical protein